MDHELYLNFNTLRINQGSSKIGIHRDPTCPLPAVVAGPTIHELDGQGGWRPKARGGRLFLADGLFDLSYGPRDAIILNGNLAHGVTTLRDLPGAGGVKGATEIERFSCIVFSDFCKGKVVKEGNYDPTWNEKEMGAKVILKEGVPLAKRLRST